MSCTTDKKCVGTTPTHKVANIAKNYDALSKNWKRKSKIWPEHFSSSLHAKLLVSKGSHPNIKFFFYFFSSRDPHTKQKKFWLHTHWLRLQWSVTYYMYRTFAVTFLCGKGRQIAHVMSGRQLIECKHSGTKVELKILLDHIFSFCPFCMHRKNYYQRCFHGLRTFS